VRTRFGPFVVDSRTRQLWRDEHEIHLSPKAFDVLCALLDKRPQVVDKSELVKRIWPDTFVLDANLNVLIGEVRKALGDTPQQPQFIRTVHGVGYAFHAPAVSIDSASTTSHPPRWWLLWRDRTFALSEGANLIGRDPECAIWLDESGVSRRHACVHIDAASGRATVEDLNSTNGTFVGTKFVNGKHVLSDGDVIDLGSVQLKFRIWSGDGSKATERIRR
jgi:DNA-binding winged helix-turn-helix (wHTH) protein